MEHLNGKALRVGDWIVNPVSGDIARNGESVRLETRTMRLLLCLAEKAGEVVSIDEVLDQVWPGVSVSPDSAYQAVATLRRQLGDDPKQPRYIATVPRLGYRLVAQVSEFSEQSTPSEPTQAVLTTRSRIGLWWALAAAVCVAVVIGVLFEGRVAGHNQNKSVAVMPFLDLTEHMKDEEFADGITEELIDKLSRIPGLRVPSPTSSFYYKGKQIAVADIAKALGVAYILDGSVRKSGTWVRVDVRLVRAETGYVVWSQTYDQPKSDILTIQDDIAGKVTKTLRASIEDKR